MSLRTRASWVALVGAASLTIGKLVLAWLSGSVAVLGEGLHSSLDLVSALIAVLTMREALKPADSDHPFGHGKIETLAAFAEAVLLVVASIYTAVHATELLLHPRPLAHEGATTFAMAGTLVVSYAVYRHNVHAAKVTQSTAVYVNAMHFLADVLTSIGVVAGLAIAWATGWLWVDPIIAYGVSAYVLYVAYQLLRQALGELVDVQLPPAELKQIQGIVAKFKGSFISMQSLRTRKSGAFRHIDFHLLVCGHLSVNQSHELCDQIEAEIEAAFPNSTVKIHVEPCSVANQCQAEKSNTQCMQP